MRKQKMAGFLTAALITSNVFSGAGLTPAANAYAAQDGGGAVAQAEADAKVYDADQSGTDDAKEDAEQSGADDAKEDADQSGADDAKEDAEQSGADDAEEDADQSGADDTEEDADQADAGDTENDDDTGSEDEETSDKEEEDNNASDASGSEDEEQNKPDSSGEDAPEDGEGDMAGDPADKEETGDSVDEETQMPEENEEDAEEPSESETEDAGEKKPDSDEETSEKEPDASNVQKPVVEEDDLEEEVEDVLEEEIPEDEKSEDLVRVWSDEKDPVLMEADEEDDLSSQFFGIERASEICPTYDEAYDAMIAMKDELYEGMPWTNFQPYGNEGEWGKYYRFQGGSVKGASLGVGCAAFVFILSDEAFGNLPARTIDRGGFKYEDVKVGDILRVNNSHFVIVLRVGSGGVTVAEGNYNKSVHWGRSMSKSEVLNANFIVTRYPAGYSEEQNADEIFQSGTEGSLSWTLTNGGTLTISGKGAMPDYTESKRPGWEQYADKINQVIIEDGVQSIGDYAFYKSPALSVQIPETVTSIGKAAFRESNLTGITAPGSVKVIGDEAFYNCQGLKSATFHEGVQSIGVDAFRKCGIAYLDFPASITSVGAAAFMECDSLVQVRFAPGEQKVSLGDNLFSKCYYLSDVTLPLKADKISSGMFANCYMALTYLYIPAEVEMIADTNNVASGSPFAGCTRLDTIDFGGTEAEWNAKGGRFALTYSGLTNQVTVNYNVDFDDPFAEIPGDPGEFVTCEHVDKNGDGRCDLCDSVLSADPDEPAKPDEPGDDKEEPDNPGSSGGDDKDPANPDDSQKPGDSQKPDDSQKPGDIQKPGDTGNNGNGGNTGSGSGSLIVGGGSHGGSGGSHGGSSSSSGSRKSSGSASTGVGPGSSSGSLPSNVAKGNWAADANGNWKFTDENGAPYVNRWGAVENPYANAQEGAQNYGWFRFDENGNMITGWFTDPEDGNTYYMNPESDGTQGMMMTGWVTIDGKEYYFNPESDGTQGRMYRNETTPDGHRVDENGAKIQ